MVERTKHFILNQDLPPTSPKAPFGNLSKGCCWRMPPRLALAPFLPLGMAGCPNERGAGVGFASRSRSLLSSFFPLRGRRMGLMAVPGFGLAVLCLLLSACHTNAFRSFRGSWEVRLPSPIYDTPTHPLTRWVSGRSRGFPFRELHKSERTPPPGGGPVGVSAPAGGGGS